MGGLVGMLGAFALLLAGLPDPGRVLPLGMLGALPDAPAP